jgi:tetratricopeptide (TPR) repeat protein
MGSADKVIAFGELGYELSRQLTPHQYLDFKPIAAVANQYVWEGRWNELKKIGTQLQEQGKKTSNPRCIFTGQQYLGFALFLLGKSDQSMEYFREATKASADIPFYRYWATAILGMIYTMAGQIDKAGKLMDEVKKFTTAGGVMALGSYSLPYYGIALFARGRMNDGWKILQNVAENAINRQRKRLLVVAEFFLGNFFSQLAAPTRPLRFSILIKNFVFLIKNIPGAAKKAERHFHKTIKLAEETQSTLYAGFSWMELGRMFKAKKKKDKAGDCFREAIKIFIVLENEFYIEQLKEALSSLK